MLATVATGDLELIDSDKVAALLDWKVRYRSVYERLYDRDFDSTLAMYSELRSLMKELRRFNR